MTNFSKIPHPLLSDSGICQSERYPTLLNPDSIQIDDQQLDDVLVFINKYARFVNFYDEQFNIGNWKELFVKSPPFLLASLSKIDVESLRNDLSRLTYLVNEFPEKENYQVLIDFVFSELITVFEQSLQNIRQINGSFSLVLERLMSSTLRSPLTAFISLTKELIDLESIKGIEFNSRLSADLWNLDPISTIAPSALGNTTQIVENINQNANVFLNELNALAVQANRFLPQTIYPNMEEDQGKIVPHIGLLIAFLNLQKRFKKDLNDISRKHLLFFYNKVLQIKGKPARPDETFVVFQLQKQVETSYFLPEGTGVKDGKDDNKADIVFALEKDIVLDKAVVTEVKTLFLNPVHRFRKSETDKDCSKEPLEKMTEGLYIAPKANTKDGIEEAFKENPKNWSTLGAKSSKLVVEEAYQDHPTARLGFILASPVLLLKGGERKITTNLCCRLAGEVDEELIGKVKGYYDITLNGLLIARAALEEEVFEKLINRICRFDRTLSLDRLNKDCELIINAANQEALRDHFSLAETTNSFTYKIEDVIELLASEKIDEKTGSYLYSLLKCRAQLTIWDFFSIGFNNFSDIRGLFFKQPFKIYLSGEEGWMEVPNESLSFDLLTKTEILAEDNDNEKDFFCSPTNDNNDPINIRFTVNLDDAFPAITFSDPKVLQEEIGSFHPAMKVELDPDYKLICDSDLYKPCCPLSHCREPQDIEISAYHVFSQLEIVDSCIDVEVCGVKDLIVQNDESLQDVNALVYPFGTRPNVADFNRDFIHKEYTDQEIEDQKPNLVGSNFYIGSREIFLKAWNDIHINISWKDKPSDFKELYLAYRYHDEDGNGFVDKANELYGLDKDEFEINLSLLEGKKWLREHGAQCVENRFTKHCNRKLFASSWTNTSSWCPFYYVDKSYIDGTSETPFDQVIRISSSQFPNFINVSKDLNEELVDYNIDTREGFLRLTLENQDFLHKDYAFVLARQMMALGFVASGNALEGAVYVDTAQAKIILFSNLHAILVALENGINQACTLATAVLGFSTTIMGKINSLNGQISDVRTILNNGDILNIDITTLNLGQLQVDFDEVLGEIGELLNVPPTAVVDSVPELDIKIQALKTDICKVKSDKDKLESLLSYFNFGNDVIKPLEVPIPNEPWTPIIDNISLDYTAKAEESDIQLIHIYPFEGCYSIEDITASPRLIPKFDDEGTLFIGLDKITTGNTLNLLFNMAEATANTEMEKAEIVWSYLKTNEWKILEPGFSVINDGTLGLTQSGIVEITIPDDINKAENTVMPSESYWIKAATKENSKAVCKTINLHTQAAKVKAVLSPNNDLTRLLSPLAASKINRLDTADTSIKKVTQPIASFNGRPMENETPTLLFRRISERLRHKGRAINIFDYERLVLENFPQVFKAKTINHALGLPAIEFVSDLEVVAPGHVLMAVIPDILQLSAGNSLTPSLPLSQLTQIKKTLQKKSTPFVQIKVLNPRYEKVNVAIKAKFQKGNEGPFFIKKLAQDIEAFLAPWKEGKTDRFHFGGILSRSHLINFVEGLFYVDYICQLDWVHEYDLNENCRSRTLSCCRPSKHETKFIAPLTARSILTAGEIKVCQLDKPCESYDGNAKLTCDNHPTQPPIPIL